ncbi:MAG: recombinase family protein, partial [Paracoccaceae bacterium]|nr:recombinase family protein [Paracoccaceae bacterium]
MKVAVYARVSTTDKGQQVDRQISQLQDICQTNGWEITKEYIDNGISGTKKSRPALNEMMKDARQRKFKMIVCLELSR